MTSVVTDIVDVYVFRRLNARVQFLLLQRRNDVAMAQTWQAFHHEIVAGQQASDAARKAVQDLASISIDRFYSADFINQFYDEARDAVVLAPVLAVTLVEGSSVELSEDFQDAGWFDRDQATARLSFSGQRWAVRHIDEIMSIGETESEIYRFSPEQFHGNSESLVLSPVSDLESPLPADADDDDGLEPMAEAHQHANAEPVPAESPDDEQNAREHKADST